MAHRPRGGRHLLISPLASNGKTPMHPTRRSLIASLVLASALPLAALAQAPAASSCTPKGNAPMKVKLTTSMGPIVVQLAKEKAPLSTENFVKYVEARHYNGTIFHR